MDRPTSGGMESRNSGNGAANKNQTPVASAGSFFEIQEPSVASFSDSPSNSPAAGLDFDAAVNVDRRKSKWNKISVQGINIPAVEINGHVMRAFMGKGICRLCNGVILERNAAECRLCNKIVHKRCLDLHVAQMPACVPKLDIPDSVHNSPMKDPEEDGISTADHAAESFMQPSLEDSKREEKPKVKPKPQFRPDHADEKFGEPAKYRIVGDHRLVYYHRRSSRQAACKICNIRLHSTQNKFYLCEKCGDHYHMGCIKHAYKNPCKTCDVYASVSLKMNCVKFAGNNILRVNHIKIRDPACTGSKSSVFTVTVGIVSEKCPIKNEAVEFESKYLAVESEIENCEWEIKKTAEFPVNRERPNSRLVFEISQFNRGGLFKRRQFVSSRCCSFAMIDLNKPFIEGSYLLLPSVDGLSQPAISCNASEAIAADKLNKFKLNTIEESLAGIEELDVLQEGSEDEYDKIYGASADPINIGMFRSFRMVGKGSYGVVWKCMHVKSGLTLAVKEISKPESVKSEDVDGLLEETKVNKILSEKGGNPFTLLFKAAFQNVESCFLVMDAMICDMNTYLNQMKKMDDSYIQVYMLQIAYGLDYIHSARIIYRDLKLENILMNTEGQAKICDFGVSKLLAEGKEETMSCTGTPLFMAPECFEYSGYSFTVDWYAFGIVAFILRANRYIFSIQDQSTFISEMKRKEADFRRGTFTPDLKNLIAGTLKKNPRHRYQYDDIISHKYFQQHVNIPLNELRMPIPSAKMHKCRQNKSMKVFETYEDKVKHWAKYESEMEWTSRNFKTRNYIEGFDYYDSSAFKKF